MKQKYSKVLALMIIVFLGVLFQKSYINEFPSYTHAWAQSDRFALAKGFVNNDLNFLKPETFVLNHQFPDDWKVPSKESITAVDFPIHDYIPAVFMKLSGNSSPWIFRIYTLLYSFIGLFFLFKIANRLTNSLLKSIFVLVFAATSPVYVYYQSGFLPSIPSLSNAIIGIYFYIKFIQNKKDVDFNISILFLTLGVLSRTTFAIPLIAIFGLELLRVIQRASKLRPKIIPILLSLIAILSFFFYNIFLRQKYGSIFLNQFAPAKSVAEALVMIQVVIEKWLFHYFSLIHYVVLISVLVVGILMLITRRVRFEKENKTILFLVLIIFFGCTVFSVLMLRQFPDHDYYFLDTFFLPMVLLFAIFLSIIPLFKLKIINVVLLLIIILFSVTTVINALTTQKEKRITGNWDRITTTALNFKGAEQLLDSLKISTAAKILVIDAYAPNIPFILMGRKGYAILSTKRDIIENALTWNYDYVVVQNKFFLSDIYSSYPEIISKIHIIGGNSRISVCKLNENERNPTLEEFLGFSAKEPVLQQVIDFEASSYENWRNINATSKFKYRGKYSGFLSKDSTYGLTYSVKNLPELKDENRVLFLQSHVLHDSSADVTLVIVISENGENLFYETYNLQSFLKKKNSWEKATFSLNLPQINKDEFEFSVFLWNTGKSELYIDDFEIKIY